MQNSQENTCAGVSLKTYRPTAYNFIEKWLRQKFSCELCNLQELFHFFKEHLWSSNLEKRTLLVKGLWEVPSSIFCSKIYSGNEHQHIFVFKTSIFEAPNHTGRVNKMITAHSTFELSQFKFSKFSEYLMSWKYFELTYFLSMFPPHSPKDRKPKVFWYF